MIPETQSLREELSRTRHTVIQLMPQPIRDVLQTYYDCQTTADHREWQRRTADKLLELASARPPRGIEGGSLSHRAQCPLCGEGSNTSSDAQGFAFPEGLLRHLTGTHNAYACPVFEVATALCREHVLEVERRARSAY